jgi:hypothetical protein
MWRHIGVIAMEHVHMPANVKKSRRPVQIDGFNLQPLTSNF